MANAGKRMRRGSGKVTQAQLANARLAWIAKEQYCDAAKQKLFALARRQPRTPELDLQVRRACDDLDAAWEEMMDAHKIYNKLAVRFERQKYPTG